MLLFYYEEDIACREKINPTWWFCNTTCLESRKSCRITHYRSERWNVSSAIFWDGHHGKCSSYILPFSPMPSAHFMSHIAYSAGRGFSGYTTDCPCGVLCREITTCLLYVGPLFRNRRLNNNGAVGLTWWIVNRHFVCILTKAIVYVLIHHMIFWLDLHLLNSVLYFYQVLLY